MTLPRLLVLTDRTQIPPGRTLPETVAACVRGGATHVVMRELDLSHEARAELAAELIRIPDLILIAARAWFPGSTGVHLSAVQATPSGPAFNGRSCHDEAEVQRAVATGASYATISPVAQSDSKPGYGPPLGATGVRRLAVSAGGMPVFALGGVDCGNARSFLDAGAYGVAVMGALMRAADPEMATKRLLTEANR